MGRPQHRALTASHEGGEIKGRQVGQNSVLSRQEQDTVKSQDTSPARRTRTLDEIALINVKLDGASQATKVSSAPIRRLRQAITRDVDRSTLAAHKENVKIRRAI
jgi:hypothetical protein